MGKTFSKEAKTRAEKKGVNVQIWQVDLEKNGDNPLQEDFYGGILDRPKRAVAQIVSRKPDK